MSVTDAADNNASNSGWGQNNTNWENSSNGTNGTNQWLVNVNTNDKAVCGSWAQAVSGDSSSSLTNNNNIPNNNANKSNQNDLIDENGSQNNQNIASHFDFDDLNDLYSTKWGKSVCIIYIVYC